jgi:hypothetical protein
MKFKKIVLAYDMEGETIIDLQIKVVRIAPLSDDETNIGRSSMTLDMVRSEIQQGVPYFAGKQRLSLNAKGMLEATREETEIDELGQLPAIEEFLLKEQEDNSQQKS